VRQLFSISYTLYPPDPKQKDNYIEEGPEQVIMAEIPILGPVVHDYGQAYHTKEVGEMHYKQAKGNKP